MLQDSNVNVYEDENVVVPETAEFNIRGRVIKVQSASDKKEQAKRQAEVLKKQKIMAEMKSKQLTLAEQPATLKITKNLAVAEGNEYEYFSKKVAELDLLLPDNLVDEDGQAVGGDLDQFIKNTK